METEIKRSVFIFIQQDQKQLFGYFYYKDIEPEGGEDSYFIITRNNRRLSFRRDFIYMPHPVFGNDYNQGPVKPFHDILESGLRAQNYKINPLELDIAMKN